jgi:hypothetical protein
MNNWRHTLVTQQQENIQENIKQQFYQNQDLQMGKIFRRKKSKFISSSK